jgi:hypothetical protein
MPARDRLLDGTLDRYVGEKRYRHADGYVRSRSRSTCSGMEREPLIFWRRSKIAVGAEDRSAARASARGGVGAALALWSLDRRGIVTLSEGRLLESLLPAGTVVANRSSSSTQPIRR